MDVGIVGGAGRMGSWFARLIASKGFRVSVYDINAGQAAKVGKMVGVSVAGSLQSLVEGHDTIIVATPPQTLRNVLSSIALELSRVGSKGTVVFDIATFKSEVIGVYTKFPEAVKVASAHPLFGPGASISAPEKYTVAVTPIPGRESGASYVEKFLSQLGFKVVSVNHRLHDEVISLTIGLSYAIGVALAALSARVGVDVVDKLSGTTFKILSMHYRSVISDNDSFIEYVLSQESVRRTVHQYVELLSKLMGEELQALELTKALKEAHGGARALREAYERMYACLDLSLNER